MDRDDEAMNQTLPTSPRRLERADGPLAGVATGVARSFGFDPLWAQLAVVALVFLNGVGLLAYLVGWLLLPRAGDPGPVRREPVRLIAGLVLAFATFQAATTGLPAVFLAVALVAAGVYVWERRPDAEAVGPPPPPPVAPTPPSDPTARSTYEWASPKADGGATTESSTPPRRRPPVAAVFLNLAVVAMGLFGFLSDGAPTARYVGVGLVVVGAGAVVAALVGGRLWPFVGAVALGLTVLAVSPGVDAVRDGIGVDQVVVVSSSADLEDAYGFEAGAVELDLRAVDLERDRTIEIVQPAGYLELRVPPDLVVEVDTEGNGGLVVVDGEEQPALGVEPGATLTVDVDGGVLFVEVTR